MLFIYCYAECCYAKHRYAECCMQYVVMLNVVRLSDVTPPHSNLQILIQIFFADDGIMSICHSVD